MYLERINRDSDNPENNGGNDTTEKFVEMKVEDATVKVVYEGEGEEKSIKRMEYPPEKANDKEWQERATKKINLVSLESKNNLDKSN